MNFLKVYNNKPLFANVRIKRKSYIFGLFRKCHIDLVIIYNGEFGRD